MAPQQSKEQQKTVARVMHEFAHGELKIRGTGPKVKNPKQAIAIALHEAGATNQEGAATNKRNLRRTKAKERDGETAEAATEGKGAQDRTMRDAVANRPHAKRAGATRAELYAEAKRRDLPGRSKMSKDQLVRALHR